jgi:AcrR family transcriptional regulator
VINMNKRPYTMRARAESARATYRRILDAAESRFLEHWYDQVTLEQIAEDAEVSKQTVLRRFGSKEGLFAAVADELSHRYEASRAKVAENDLERAAAAITSEYERTGLTAIRLSAMEERFPALHDLLESGRARRREWVERTFTHLVPARSSKDYKRRVAMLMDITSPHTWKVLRHDLKLSRKDTERAVYELLAGVQCLDRRR